METLAEIFKRIGHFGGDVGHNDKNSTHSYIDGAYEKLLAPFRERCDFMEVGIASGMSMKLWGDYFSIDCTITGVDLSLTFDTSSFDSRFTFIVADATKPDFVSKLSGKMFDVCIDDGSHSGDDQVATFQLLKNSMNPGGLYVIEDILSLEIERKRFESLHPSCEIYDLRNVKGRFDDVLICFRF